MNLKNFKLNLLDILDLKLEIHWTTNFVSRVNFLALNRGGGSFPRVKY